MISWVGVDISKSNLVVWVKPQNEGFDVSNTSEGFLELIQRLSRFDVGMILLEATGGYERHAMGPCKARTSRCCGSILAEPDPLRWRWARMQRLTLLMRLF